MEQWNGDERRKNRDIWKVIAQILALGGWLFFIVALLVSYYAAPEQSYGYMRYKAIDTRDSWLIPMTGYLYLILWFSALSSYLSLTIDKFRKRRVTDNTRFNAVLLLVISIAWSAYIIFHILK